ncbi:hypothetical protein B9G55_14435 [Saccharibacillus sp. O16]|nr:hypothetical protein B9G55_14435 [Saccharibacillus sp. O16]
MEEKTLTHAAQTEPFDPLLFWSDDDYFTSPEEVTDERIAQVENLLGYKLPADYISLLRIRNGGCPVNTCVPVGEPDSVDEGYLILTGICGIGGQWGLDSEDLGSRFMIEEWGYPDIGIVFGECPSAGHDAMMLDYRECGPQGEPAVIHVAVEMDEEPEILPLASSFGEFVRALVHEDVYDTSEEDKQAALEQARTAPLTPRLQELCTQAQDQLPDAERKIRTLAEAIIEEKGFFALHSDFKSCLMYDLEFLLVQASMGSVERESYLQTYTEMLVFGPKGTLNTGGYAPGFVSDWLDARLNKGRILTDPADGRLTFDPAYADEVRRRLEQESF